MIRYDKQRMLAGAQMLMELSLELRMIMDDFHEDAARTLGAAVGPQSLSEAARTNQATDEFLFGIAQAVKELAESAHNVSEAAEQGDQAASRNIDVAALKSGLRVVV